MTAQTGNMSAVHAPFAAEVAYDMAAPFYDNWKWQRFWRSVELPFIEDCFSLLDGKIVADVLDVGCGTGWYLKKLRGLSAKSVGIDVSMGMLAQARSHAPHAVLKYGDMRHLPFDDGQFDVVLSTRVLSHLPNSSEAIHQVTRVLRRRGLVVLSNIDAEHDYEQTRLPIAGGHIFAETYKHSRQLIGKLLVEAGLEHSRSALISKDGALTPVDSLDTSSRVPIVGWISAWTR